MRKVIAFFLLTLLFSFCRNKNSNQNNQTPKEPSPKMEALTFVPASLALRSALCDNENEMQCAEVALNYFKMEGGDTIIREKINRSIHQILTNTFLQGDQSSTGDTNFEKAAQQFIDDYESYVKEEENKNFITPFANQTDCKILYETPEMVCLSFSNYSNTGGAHGNYYTELVNIDKMNGAEIKAEAIIKDKAQLSKILEAAAKKHYKVADDQSLKDIGLYYEGDDFPVNDNVGILKDSLIFEYNPYEVGPYVLGGMSLKIAKKDIKDLLL